MRINTSYVQKCKVVAHVFQVLFVFVAACITIAVLTKGGQTGGATKFFFALTFLTTPGIVYLAMVPMWSRAARFANAYAFAALDGLYTLLWFAAFISVAMWNADGIKQGAKDAKVEKRNCTTFKYGNESKCKLSRAAVGLGIVVFIFFVITASISGYYLHKFRKEGILPYESNKQNPHHTSGESAKDNAWSTEIEQGEHSDDDDDDRHTERGGNQEEDEYALLHSTETDDGRHPGRPLSWGDDRRYSQGPVQPPYAAYDDGPNALSPGGYEDYRREGREGNNFGGQGYSFSGGR